LSCNVLELGYDVVPVPETFIHDYSVKDRLRELNKGGSEGMIWESKWRRKDGKIGPIVSKEKKTILYGESLLKLCLY
jgi:hypothetical protein